MDPSATTLGEIVRDRPNSAVVFERLGLDYCCGGAKSLADAVAEVGLDAATVAAMLDAIGDGPQGGTHDVAAATIPELCEHIITSHHGPLRTSLIRAGDLVATVVRVHGPEHPELADVDRVFTGLRAEFEEHMIAEERDLFPAARAIDSSPEVEALGPEALALLEDQHQETGEALVELRRLCGDYSLEDAFCNTHRAMLTQLEEIERDTHQHVHEENNILFPRIRELTAAAA